MPVPTLSQRTARIAPFHTMELMKRAAALQQAGRPVIHMSIGEPDFKAPEPVVAALERAVRAGHTEYTSAVGIEPLRRAIAADYGRRHGLDVDPGRIIVTAGASAALSLACCALVDPGAEVLLTDPGYPCNRHFVTAFDGVPVGVPVDADSRFQMTPEKLRAHWSPRTRGTLLASPANPTGTSIPFDELGRMVDFVRARNGFSLIDEIYLGLSYEGPMRSALELGDDIIVSNSFSKYFHMTGWRLGWLVVPPSLVGAFEKLSQNLYICASTLAQHAALACFREESLAIFEERREAFRHRRDFLVPALREAGLGVPVVPDGAFYVYADCSRFSQDSSDFADRLLEEAWVSVVPGMDFGSHAPRAHLRFAYTTGMDALQEAASRIKRWLGR
jgi:aspartate/methionine/tyrosine aminotransferase